MELTSKQRQYLRGLAHHIDPVVLVGDSGLSEAVIEKTREELEHHELIKVRFLDTGELGAREAGAPLAAAAGATLVQVIGRMAVLYKARAKKPDIKLPPAKPVRV